MENKIVILPGTPDDDNREYLPESIIGTDLVVNENGNNSQPYPKRLEEHVDFMGNEFKNTWYEYVPECYDPSKKTPLVISNHGGLMTGWGQCIYTSWTHVADRDNVIVIFPSASAKRLWTLEGGVIEDRVNAQMPPEMVQNLADIDENCDVRFVKALIAYACDKYNIDTERIFMQGMSNGSMFTAQFEKYFGNMLAGGANSGGSTPNLRQIFEEDMTVKNVGGPTPVWHSVPETNGCPPLCEFDDNTCYKYARLYWLTVNECDNIPEISIVGEHNMAFYKGKKADYVYMDIKNRDHGQTLDEACVVWDYFFSGLRRKSDGTVVDEGPRIARKGDAFGIAVADGANKAWFGNAVVDMGMPAIKWQKLKYHGLNGGQKVKGEYLTVPLSFIARSFQADCRYSEDTLSAALRLKDGRTLQFARGSIGCVIENNLRSMYCEALHRNGELYISLEWFARFVMNLTATRFEDVLYVTDHHAELSDTFAALIRDLLTGDYELRQLDWPKL